MKLQKPREISGLVAVTINVGKPDRRRRDLDNIATKAILDLLTAHGIIQDDAMVVKLAASWDASIPPGTVRVTVEPAMVMAEAEA